MPALDLRHNIHNVPDVDPAMLAWTRLPTPIPHAAPSTASTPSSSSPSSAFPAPKSLSIYTSSVADGLLPSPLPSPRESSSSGGSKTAAFFSSFAAAGPPIPTPPPPPLRSETIAVVSKPKESLPTRSATADFFAVSSMGARPTPPPSVKSTASSREPSPPRLPPLSRIFPSRYASERTLAEDEEELSSTRKKGTDWETNFKREFLNLTEAASQLPPSPPLMTSPTQMNPISPPMERLQLPNPHMHHSHAHSAPIRRETHLVKASRGSGDSGYEEAISGEAPTLISGTHLESGTAQLTLVRALGEGAFSSVWLATDDAGTLPSPSESRSRPETLRRKSSSWAKKGRDKRMQGITPPATVSAGFSLMKAGEASDPDGSVVLDEQVGEGAIAATDSPTQALRPKGRLVAVKMINRALCDANDRTRISFVREVEVLRHIAHPSIVAYLHSFTSDSHHCLVLEHVGGGELFDLVNSDTQFAQVTEPAVRRIWGELCRAVGWMHGAGLVHRDIKLENILLTRNIFSANEPLPPPSTALIKLTDFGLSRFIDPSSPLLSTRCGSESYAAPELVLGGSSTRPATSDSDSSESGEPKGYYDGRQTDAWACGVVLYALATRQLPFDAPPPLPMSYSAAPSRAGSVRSTRSNRSGASGTARLRTTNRRRDMLMRIAQCEYYWPDEIQYGDDEPEDEDEVDPPVAAARRLASPGLKRVVRRLLERSQARRARMVDLWDEPWLRGEGAPSPPFRATPASEEAADGEEGEGVGEDETEWSAHDGLLLDGEHIDSVASQELDPI